MKSFLLISTRSKYTKILCVTNIWSWGVKQSYYHFPMLKVILVLRLLPFNEIGDDIKVILKIRKTLNWKTVCNVSLFDINLTLREFLSFAIWGYHEFRILSHSDAPLTNLFSKFYQFLAIKNFQDRSCLFYGSLFVFWIILVIYYNSSFNFCWITFRIFSIFFDWVNLTVKSFMI